MINFEKNEKYLFVLSGGGGDLHQIGLTIVFGENAEKFLNQFKYQEHLVKKIIKLSDEIKLTELFN